MSNFDYSKIVATNPDDARVLSTAQTLYGEFAGVEDPELRKQYMIEGGSSAYNAQEYGGEWSGMGIRDILNTRFNAVKDINQPFREALDGKFSSEDAWKQAIQIAYGLDSGKIKRTNTLFRLLI